MGRFGKSASVSNLSHQHAPRREAQRKPTSNPAHRVVERASLAANKGKDLSTGRRERISLDDHDQLISNTARRAASGGKEVLTNEATQFRPIRRSKIIRHSHGQPVHRREGNVNPRSAIGTHSSNSSLQTGRAQITVRGTLSDRRLNPNPARDEPALDSGESQLPNALL